MTSEKTCPRCGSPASGNFCNTCGAPLGAGVCPSCGAPSEAGARFCNACGTPLTSGGTSGGRQAAPLPAAAGASSSGDARLAWWAAGGMLIILILVLGWPVLRRGNEEAPAPVAGAAAAQGPSSVDLSTMTPREAADALFNRVMRLAAEGDTAGSAGFLPMAISAYERAQPLDSDGLYHLSLLERTAGDATGALSTAEGGLADAPGHILLLYAAAEAARELGDLDKVGAFYARALESWDAEIASGNPDYEAHSTQLPDIRRAAESAVGGGP